MPVTSPRTPWYSHRWPWLIMAGPAIVVVAALGTAWLAWSTDDGVVADDYYKRAVLALGGDGGARVLLSGFADAAALPPSLRLKLTNATRAGLDRVATLTRDAGGTYSGRIDPPPPGRWLVSVETDTWRLPAVEVGGAVQEVRLGAARGGE